MDIDQLIALYENINVKNLPKSEAMLAANITQYLRTSVPNDSIGSALHELLEGLLACSDINNMDTLFIRESQGTLSDLSISISSFFSQGGDLDHIVHLLASLKVACAVRGLEEATELISSIEHRLHTNRASDRIPVLQSLSILGSIIERTKEYSGSKGLTLTGTSPGQPALQSKESSNHFTRGATASQRTLEQRILIVEDESVIASTIGFILSDLDLPIDVVSDGAAALDRLNARPYSLVISDVEMPIFDGFSLLTAMKRDDQFSDLPIVFMSDKETYREQMTERGAAGFFLKGSIRGEELVLLISNALCDAPFVPQI